MYVNTHTSVFVTLSDGETFDVDIPGRGGKTPTRIRISQVTASRSDTTPSWGIGGAGFRVNKSTGELSGGNDARRRTYRNVSRFERGGAVIAAALPLPVRIALREQGVSLDQIGAAV
jgi:hypothetical protein